MVYHKILKDCCLRFTKYKTDAAGYQPQWRMASDLPRRSLAHMAHTQMSDNRHYSFLKLHEAGTSFLQSHSQLCYKNHEELTEQNATSRGVLQHIWQSARAMLSADITFSGVDLVFYKGGCPIHLKGAPEVEHRRGCGLGRKLERPPRKFLYFLYQNGEFLCIPGDIYWHCNCINCKFGAGNGVH